MNNTQIQSEKQLRKLIKPYNKMLDKRIQTQLDQLSMEYIGESRLAALFMNRRIDYINWDGHSLIVHSPASFSIAYKHPNSGPAPVSLYLLIPGIHHGLRINGMGEIRDNRLTINITALYFQCARAATRAQLWDNTRHQPSHASLEQFVYSSRFCLLGTNNKEGMTELSPRGEASQAIALLNSEQILLPERPGNKVAISLRNILEDSNITLSLLKPGLNQSVSIKGQASLTVRPDYLTSLAIKDKAPALAILIDVENIQINEENSITKSQIWHLDQFLSESDLTPFSKAINQHMNGNGLFGKATQKVVSGVINKDMANLY